MAFSQEHFKTISYANFGGQTECIMGNWKIVNWILITRHRKNPKQSGVVAGFEVCYADLYILFGWSFSHQVKFCSLSLKISTWVVCVNGKHSRVAWVRSLWGSHHFTSERGRGFGWFDVCMIWFSTPSFTMLFFLGVCTCMILFFSLQHLQDLRWIGWKSRVSWFREHVKHCSQHQLWFWIWRKNRYRQRPRSIFWIVVDCKTVRIFAYSSTREQSNKRSGTRLKIESETGENGRVRLDSHATLYRFLYWFWEKKNRLFCSLGLWKAPETRLFLSILR